MAWFEKTQQLSQSSPDNIAVLRAGNIQQSLETASDLIYVPRSIVSDMQKLREGDIAICLSSGSPQIVGKTARLNENWDGTVGGFCGVIRPERIDSEFLSQWLRGPQYLAWRDEQARGANIQNLRFSELGDLEIQVPPVSQQRHIATCLKSQLAEVEAARQAAQAQVRDADLLRHRLLRQAFDGLQDVPRKVLGDHAHVTSGVTPSRSNAAYWQPAEIPWVKTGEIDFSPIKEIRESISKWALAECSLSLLPPQTVLLAITGEGKTRGRSAVLEIPAATNQHAVAIMPNDVWEASFMQLWLQSSYHDLRELSDGRGGSRSALSGAQIKALEIPAPSHDQQRRIVQHLKAQLIEADSIRQAATTQLAEIELLPQRLLAQAFGAQQGASP